MNHTIEFSIIPKDYVEGECLSYNIHVHETGDDDFIVQRSWGEALSYPADKEFIAKDRVRFTFCAYKNGKAYDFRMNLVEVNGELALQPASHIPKEITINKDFIDYLRILHKDERERKLEDSMAVTNEYADWSMANQIQYTGSTEDITGMFNSKSVMAFSMPNYTNITVGTTANTAGASSTTYPASSGFNGSIGKLFGSSGAIWVYNDEPSTNPRALINTRPMNQVILKKMLELFNRTERGDIIQKALGNSTLCRAIINAAEEMKIPSWCEAGK